MSDKKALLAIYDITGIQEYIFATSRLAENAGASWIVGRTLREFLPGAIEEAVKELGGKAVTNWQANKGNGLQMRKDPSLQAEVVYIGGGSAVVAYRKETVYDRVNRLFAQRLLVESYTLTVATASVETEFEDYVADREQLENRLDEAKAGMLRLPPMGALPVVEQEALTGLPVTRYEYYQNRRQDLSTLQWMKRWAYKEVKHRAELIYRGTLREGTSFAVEMEDLISRKGEDGYVAVVHIDGNGMSELIRRESKKRHGFDNQVGGIRELSAAISGVYDGIFHQMVKELEKIGKQSGESSVKLLLRPLIVDGDDVTFICNGRWGVPLAAAFLRRLARQQRVSLPLSACAGVALVHSHFPFNIAYEIAEDCCRNAKKKRSEEIGSRKDKTCGYLDFYLVQGAYAREMRELREEKKGVGKLQGRPYRIGAEVDRTGSNSFDALDKVLSKLPAPGDDGESQLWPRSQLKKLYEAYGMGMPQLGLVKKELESRDRRVSSLLGKGEEGILERQDEGLVYDALELMDLYERELFSAWKDIENREAAK